MSSARVPAMVSVIVPVHDRPGPLREAVRSALEQDHRPLEVLIVDDGSRDETAAVAAELAAAHAHVRLLRQEQAGPGRARETGRRAARGEFVQYLDSDDLLLPGKLRDQVAALVARPECGVAHGYTRYRDPDGRLRLERWKAGGHDARRLFPSFLRERWWETGAQLYRASVCDAVGPWSDLRLEEDWEHDCRVAALGVELCLVPEFGLEVRRFAQGHLSGGAGEIWRWQHRARAAELILGHARRAAVDPACDELRHFGRRLFLLARQCAAAGLADEARRLAALAAGVLRPHGAARDVRVFQALARVLGWSRAGHLAALVERRR